MRPTSGFFVASLVRRAFAEGTFAAIEKRGAEEAGAIFIRFRHRDGTVTLAAPALQGHGDDAGAAPGARLFEIRLDHAGEDDAASLIGKEQRFDSDLWIVEIEDETPARWVGIAKAE